MLCSNILTPGTEIKECNNSGYDCHLYIAIFKTMGRNGAST